MSRSLRSPALSTIAPVVGTLAITFLVACNRTNANATDSTASQSMSTPTTRADSPAMAAAGAHADSGGMTDANIMASEIGGDSAEVAVAKSVQSRLSAGPVRDYAGLLIRDHSKGLADARALASKLAITPVPPAGDTTAVETSHLTTRFGGMSGKTLDTAFVNHEIDDHQHDIAQAHQMSASAKNAQVKTFVDNSIPELQKHLDRAQALASGTPK